MIVVLGGLFIIAAVALASFGWYQMIVGHFWSFARAMIAMLCALAMALVALDGGPPIARRFLLCVLAIWWAVDGAVPIGHRLIDNGRVRSGRLVTASGGLGLGVALCLVLVSAWPCTWGWWL